MPLPAKRLDWFFIEREKVMGQLPTTYRRKNKNRASVGNRRVQSIEKSDALAIPENIHVHTHITLLINHAIQHSGRSSPEGRQGIPHRFAWLIDYHR